MTCFNCGMHTNSPAEYHPYAACLMFEAARDGDTVEANLRAVVEYGMRAQALGLSLDEAMSDIRLVIHAPARSE
ncbi:MAG: hypothetical protein AAF216_13755 [Pseudomonadota bacterium]